MKSIKLLAWLLLLFLPTLLTAQSEKIPIDSKIKMGKLENGLKYFIIQNKKPEKKIELRMVVNAGSIQEDDDQLGLAHLMEHMNFNGTTNFPKNEVVHYLQSIGVDFGADLNAYTSFDETVYILPIPADDKDKIDKGFQIIADWSGAALMDNQAIDDERKVVLEESRLGKGADDRMMKKWLPEYLNGSRYASRLPIGDDELLKTFKHDVIKRFHKDWYRPDLQAVCVVGDIDPAEAERLIKAKFGKFKNPANARPRPAFYEIPNRNVSKAMVLSDPEAPYTFIQIIGNSKKETKSTTVKEYVDDLAKMIFNSIMAARLSEATKSSNPPYFFATAGQGGGWARGYENFSMMAVCGTDKIKEATESLIKEAMRIKKFGVTQAELERAKAEVMANYEKMYNERDKTESKDRVEELVRHFLTNECIPGIEWEYQTSKTAIPKLSLADVNKYKEEINIDENYFALVTTKTGDNLPSDASLKTMVDNSLKGEVVAYQEKALPSRLLPKDPTPGKVINETKDPSIETTTWQLDNGAKVTFKKTDFKNDEILFSGYRFGGSSLYEGKDYLSADFSNNVVDEMGYGEFSSSDLGKFLTGKSVDVNTMVDLHNEAVSGRSTVKDLETALQLLYLKSTSPRMDPESFQSFVSKMVQSMSASKSDPQSFFGDTLNKFLYKNHPRSKQIFDEADFATLNPKNAIDFYNSRFNSANGMHYFFTGSIPTDQFKSLIEKYIGGLGGSKVASNSKDIGMEPVTGDVPFTVRKGTEPKSMVMEMSQFYTPYNNQDELLLNILSEVINNRITDIIREKMSAIYGGGISMKVSKFPKEKFGMQSYLPCGPENAEKVKSAFWDIVNECKKPGNIKAEELTKSVETAIQKYKIGVKNNNFWLATMSKYQQYGLPTNNIINYEKRVREVSLNDLTTVANKYLSSKNVLHALLMPE